METLTIAGTDESPFILMDAEQHCIEMKGQSFPENATKFYAPFFQWLETYLAEPHSETLTVTLELSYFNSSSSKVLMDLLDFLDEFAEAGSPVIVNWCYDAENDMMEECGEDFQEDIEFLEFNLVPVEE